MEYQGYSIRTGKRISGLNMSEKLLTIFTPTYNRAHLLDRVYGSLCAQTVKDFVWLIVDDGSSDGTKELVEGFSDRAPFEIRYFYQENGGKMRAHNRGSQLCDTELFLCLDSDDVLVSEAVENILKLWEEHTSCHVCMKESGKRAGIAAYKGEADGDGEIRYFADSRFDSESLARGYSTLRGLYLKGFRGETTLVFRTEMLQKYPFPEIEGEKYVPEDYIYDKIDGECPLLLMDSILTVCQLMEEGYTSQAARLRRDNPRGWLLYYRQRAALKSPLLLKIKYLSHYMRFCSVTGEKWELGILPYLAALPGAAVLALLGKT